MISYALVVDSLRISPDIQISELDFFNAVFLPKSNMVPFTMVVALIVQDFLLAKRGS